MMALPYVRVWTRHDDAADIFIITRYSRLLTVRVDAFQINIYDMAVIGARGRPALARSGQVLLAFCCHAPGAPSYCAAKRVSKMPATFRKRERAIRDQVKK